MAPPTAATALSVSAIGHNPKNGRSAAAMGAVEHPLPALVPLVAEDSALQTLFRPLSTIAMPLVRNAG